MYVDVHIMTYTHNRCTHNRTYIQQTITDKLVDLIYTLIF